jgi:signal transduction histidine kinase
MSSESVKFLLVDDLEENLLALEALLRREGLELLRARSGPEALELLLVHDFALALLDVQMPGMNGFELAELMRGAERTRRVPIIFLTAVATDEQRCFRGYEAGAVDFLIKPIAPHVLRSKAEVFFELYLQRQQVACQRDELRRIAEERERLLAREKQAREQAEAATRAKDEFLAVISHELRSPLNAILGYNLMLRGELKDSEILKKTCDVIERNARLQLQLIEDLLDTARVISGKLRLEMRLMDIASVVNDALDVVRPAAEAKGVQLRIADCKLRIAGDGDTMGEESAIRNLQSAIEESEIVFGDATRLQQVIWNLLSNAIKFTPKGGRVELGAGRDAEFFRIFVSDTGKGIEPEFLPHVFDRFYQADSSSTRRHGGLGLGLALVKSLVELHGGEVKAESEGKGRGSTFTVVLPLAINSGMAVVERPVLAPSAGDPSGAMIEDSIPLPDGVTIEGVRVLAVDDQEEARVTLSYFLGKCGAVVTTASSAAEALAFLSDHQGGERPDVLVCDIAMPGEDGYSALRRVRALEHERGVEPQQQIPAIALTAKARSEDRLQALNSGFKMHVSKPVEPAELVIVIASVVGQREHGASFSH